MEDQTINETINKSIGKLYSDAGYSKRYGGDIFITIALVIVLAGIFLYFHIINNLQVIRAKWSTEQCNPTYFPFVSIINPDPNKSAIDQMISHMKSCVIGASQEDAEDYLKPFYSKFDFLNNLGRETNIFIGMFYGVIHNLLTAVIDVIEFLMKMVKRLMIAITSYTIKMKSIMDKMFGVIATNLYILMEIFNIGMAVVLNMATITTITIMTPLIATLIFELMMGILFYASFWLSWLAPLFFIAGAATYVLIIIVGLIMVALIYIQNRTIKYSEGSVISNTPNSSNQS